MEAEGVEPTSETESSPASTSLVCFFYFPTASLSKRSLAAGSFIDTRPPQSLSGSVADFNLPYRKARIAVAFTTGPGDLLQDEAALGSLKCYFIVSV